MNPDRGKGSDCYESEALELKMTRSDDNSRVTGLGDFSRLEGSAVMYTVGQA